VDVLMLPSCELRKSTYGESLATLIARADELFMSSSQSVTSTSSTTIRNNKTESFPKLKEDGYFHCVGSIGPRFSEKTAKKSWGLLLAPCISCKINKELKYIPRVSKNCTTLAL